MNLKEFKKKYGTDSVNLMINELLIRTQVSPYMLKQYEELKRDIKDLLNNEDN